LFWNSSDLRLLIVSDICNRDGQSAGVVEAAVSRKDDNISFLFELGD
jgi:hypothetical protein